MSIVREVLERDIVRVKSGTMTSYFRRVRPGVLVMRQYGSDSSEAMADTMMRELVSVIDADGSVAPYVDLRAVSRFDASSRSVWIDFFKKYRTAMRPGCGLINSKVIEMATALIGLAVGSDLTRTTTSEEEFIKRIQLVDPTFTARDLADLSDERRGAARTG